MIYAGDVQPELQYTWVILGEYRGNGKENGNYYSIFGLYWGNIGIMEKNTLQKPACYLCRIRHLYLYWRRA